MHSEIIQKFKKDVIKLAWNKARHKNNWPPEIEQNDPSEKLPLRNNKN